MIVYANIICVDPLQIQMLIVYNTLLTIASSHSDKIFVSAWSAEHLSLMCVCALFYSFPVVADLFENDHASTLGNQDCHKFTKNCTGYLQYSFVQSSKNVVNNSNIPYTILTILPPRIKNVV